MSNIRLSKWNHRINGWHCMSLFFFRSIPRIALVHRRVSFSSSLINNLIEFTQFENLINNMNCWYSFTKCTILPFSFDSIMWQKRNLQLLPNFCYVYLCVRVCFIFVSFFVSFFESLNWCILFIAAPKMALNTIHWFESLP